MRNEDELERITNNLVKELNIKESSHDSREKIINNFYSILSKYKKEYSLDSDELRYVINSFCTNIGKSPSYDGLVKRIKESINKYYPFNSVKKENPAKLKGARISLFNMERDS